jgi:hypothetical protein
MADYWAKLYIEILDDPKMMRLPDRLFRRVCELILYAKSIRSSGLITDMDEVAWKLHLSVDELQKDLENIEASTKTNGKPGIVQLTEEGWFITNFEKRQAASPVNERVQRYREKQHKDQYYVTPPGNGNVTNRYTEEETESESETEGEAETEARASEPGDPFPAMQGLVERLTGYAATAKDIPALKEFVEQGVEEADIRAALEFYRSNGNVARGAAHLRKSVLYARAQRIQGAEARASPARAGPAPDGRPPDIPEDVWSDLVYLRQNPKGQLRAQALERLHSKNFALEIMT